MPMQPARLDFKPDGTPYSAAYGDIYHTACGGPAQARHVFVGGNDLPARWQDRDRFVILETGFGLGLNFLATWQAWRDDPQRCRRLHFVSLEKHPFTTADLATVHQAWPEFADLANNLRRLWPPLVPGTHRLHLDGERVILTLIFGDAATQLREVNASVDAFISTVSHPPPTRNCGRWRCARRLPGSPRPVRHWRPGAWQGRRVMRWPPSSSISSGGPAFSPARDAGRPLPLAAPG